MMIIGVDYHPSFQAIAFCVEETGECGEQELSHSDGQAEKLYRDLQQRGIRVRVAMEATGYSRWFERLLAELGFELWIGDPAEIRICGRTRHARIQSCNVFTAANWCKRVWGKRAWQWRASWGSGYGSCRGTRLSTTSSAVVDRSSRKAVMPVRGCQKRRMVRKVAGRLIRLPASL